MNNDCEIYMAYIRSLDSMLTLAILLVDEEKEEVLAMINKLTVYRQMARVRAQNGLTFSIEYLEEGYRTK